MTSLDPATTLGSVHLTVADLDRSLAFYTGPMGLTLIERDEGVARLGAGAGDLVVLTEVPGAVHHRHTSGLYHFAILVPSRLELARSLRRLAGARWPMHGFSDHLVSEAIYLPDPDGNGIEIYRDRPREDWPVRNGELQMDTLPLDVEDLLGELPPGDDGAGPLDPGTTLGHVHLHVADIAAAEAFYRDVIGFDLMVRYGSQASFMSAGGYHHHLGMNTWAGVGVPPPPPGSVGLRHYEIVVPDEGELGRVIERAQGAGAAVEQRAEGALVRDTSQNGVLVRTAA